MCFSGVNESGLICVSVNSVGLFEKNHMEDGAFPEAHFWDQTFWPLT